MVGHCASCGDCHTTDKHALASQRPASANSFAWPRLATVPAVEIATQLTIKLLPSDKQALASKRSVSANRFTWLWLATVPAMEIATQLTSKLLPHSSQCQLYNSSLSALSLRQKLRLAVVAWLVNVEIATQLTSKLLPLSAQSVPIASPGCGWPLCKLWRFQHMYPTSKLFPLSPQLMPIAAPMATVGHCASCGDSHPTDK